MTDPRETKQYQDLRLAHLMLEAVAIVLDPERHGRVEHDFQEDADRQGVTVNARLASELQDAMDRVANWIPCRFEGVPQCECDCPDCDPED